MNERFRSSSEYASMLDMWVIDCPHCGFTVIVERFEDGLTCPQCVKVYDRLPDSEVWEAEGDEGQQ